MIEIIYISPTCRQKAGFMDWLAWKLGERGIYDFEICQENLKLRTDIFAVSTIDIFGDNLGLSRVKVGYYIDEVSHAEYPSREARECAIKKLKQLKSGFGDEEKEISKRELIEILVGGQHEIHD